MDVFHCYILEMYVRLTYQRCSQKALLLPLVQPCILMQQLALRPFYHRLGSTKRNYKYFTMDRMLDLIIMH